MTLQYQNRAARSFVSSDETAAAENAPVFSREPLPMLARELARTQKIAASKQRPFDLLARLEDNKNKLAEAYRVLTGAAQSEQLTPAARRFAGRER